MFRRELQPSEEQITKAGAIIDRAVQLPYYQRGDKMYIGSICRDAGLPVNAIAFALKSKGFPTDEAVQILSATGVRRTAIALYSAAYPAEELRSSIRAVFYLDDKSPSSRRYAQYLDRVLRLGLR